MFLLTLDLLYFIKNLYGLTSGQDTLILMTREFDPITEVNMQPEDFGEGMQYYYRSYKVSSISYDSLTKIYVQFSMHYMQSTCIFMHSQCVCVF